VTDPILARIRAMHAEGSRRSPLAHWLRRHREAFARIIRENGANWEGFGRVFVEEGLMPRPEHFDAAGPEGHKARRRVAETARKAWARVPQDAPLAQAPALPDPMASLPVPEAKPTGSPAKAAGSPSTAQERLARLKRQTLDRSGRTT